MSSNPVSYRRSVAWIATEDEPSEISVDVLSGWISVSLVADQFGKQPDKVAEAVVRHKAKNGMRLEGATFHGQEVLDPCHGAPGPNDTRILDTDSDDWKLVVSIFSQASPTARAALIEHGLLKPKQRRKATRTAKGSGQFLTTTQVAKLFKVTNSCILNWHKHGSFPEYARGFRLTDTSRGLTWPRAGLLLFIKMRQGKIDLPSWERPQ